MLPLPLVLMPGLDPNMQATSDGSTALHIAAQFFQVDAAKFLLESGAGVMVRNFAGKVRPCTRHASASAQPHKRQFHRFPTTSSWAPPRAAPPPLLH